MCAAAKARVPPSGVDCYARSWHAASDRLWAVACGLVLVASANASAQPRLHGHAMGTYTHRYSE